MEEIKTNKQYSDLVDKKSPDSPILKNCFNAFWVGGLICLIGQIIMDYYKRVSAHGKEKDVYSCYIVK